MEWNDAIARAKHAQETGDLNTAEQVYRQVLAVDPDCAAAIHFLGVLAFQKGQPAPAIALLARALELRPDLPHFHSNIALVYQALGQLEKAVAHNRESVRLDPQYASGYHNLGLALREQGAALDEVVACYREAIRLEPDRPGAQHDLASTLMDRGDMEEALALFRRLVALHPDSAALHSNLVYCLHFWHADDRVLLLAEHQRWYQRHALALADGRTHPNPPDPERRLRVGYVSPNFCRHPVGRFLLPLLEHHDHAIVEVFCYAAVSVADELTGVMRGLADCWRQVIGMSDEQLAGLIRSDEVDVLVDLTAHLAENRLLTFARKPAPVQVTYLAYNSTTGLPTIDYRLSDPYMDPPENSMCEYAEETYWLPRSYWCYRPDLDLPPPGPLPALTNEQVTFGCLNNFRKVAPPVLAAWRELLRQVPGARLLLHAQPGSHRERVRQFLADGGVRPERVDFVGMCPQAEYFRLYERIDIGLDPFPYGGGTTTYDALWMGVPVVTLAGNAPVSRGGLGILSNLGLPELAAWTPEEYLQIAAGLASDLPRLVALRAWLRERLRKSPAMDALQFTRDVEGAYRTMWRRWCAQQ